MEFRIQFHNYLDFKIVVIAIEAISVAVITIIIIAVISEHGNHAAHLKYQSFPHLRIYAFSSSFR